jgi:hypothetical protein
LLIGCSSSPLPHSADPIDGDFCPQNVYDRFQFPSRLLALYVRLLKSATSRVGSEAKFRFCILHPCLHRDFVKCADSIVFISRCHWAWITPS